MKINIGSGKVKKEYHVYRNFATYYSPVFDRAFNGKFIEAEIQVYNLVDFDYPDVFGSVLQWMYSESLGTGWDVGDISTEDLCGLWMLGDRLLMPNLQDCVVTPLCYRSFGVDLKDNPLPVAIWIYEETVPDSPWRRLFAYKCAYELKWEQGIKSGAHELAAELISEIASAYQRDALKCKKGHACTFNQAPCANDDSYNRCDNMIDPNVYHINEIVRGKDW